MNGKDRERHQSAAVRLLKRVLSTGWFQPDAVARALAVPNATLDAYLTESQPMPLDRQLCLAQFVIKSIPQLSRAGHQLRAQVGAAMAFHSHVTETHLQGPPLRHF